MPAVYVASPLGFTVPTRAFYTDTLLPAIAATGFTVLDPWAESEEAFARAFAISPGPGRDEALRSANHDAGAANERLIRQSTCVFAVLDGEGVDSGTASEVGFAAALGRPVIGWRSDLRQAGDNSQTLVNLQVEHFVRSAGGSLHLDLDTALTALGALR